MFDLQNVEEFDCHRHKDELFITIFNTICHPIHGQLCQGFRTYEGTTFHPIVFKDKISANKWIEKGCIAELQEGLSNLKVGFTTNSFVPNPNLYNWN